jgi:Na+-transporting methylmalonyl-CoA/oxaloacetate decarboxylase gamma subunit
MEALLGVGIVFGAVLMLCLLAFIIRIILVAIAKKRGYTSDTMPMLYHLIGFGTYFSVLIIAHAIYLTIIGV